MWDEIIVPLVTWIRKEYKEPFSIGITTNGTLLGPSSLEFMKKNDMTLLLSIDGAKETQDYNRPFHSGKGTFDNLENKLPLIIRAFPNTTFRSTVIPDTVEYLFDNIMFAKN
jgi:sulfatase maturation enzyme AslB (radical SAM superfamily)